MKYYNHLIAICLSFFSLSLMAQVSAVMEFESTDKGILIPRMDSNAMKNIPNPEEGLMVYDSSRHAFCYFSNSEWMVMSRGQASFIEKDSSVTNELQTISISNDTIYLENGGFVVLPEDNVEDGDFENDNEIQTISKSGSTVTLSHDGGVFTDSVLTETTVDQMVSNNGFVTSADDADSDPENEIQDFRVSVQGDTLFLSQSNWVIISGISESQPLPPLNKLFGGNEHESGADIIRTYDGGYLMAVDTRSSLNGDVSDETNGSNDIWVVKLNRFGEIVWDKLIGGSGNESNPKLIQLDGGGYFLSCSSYSSESGDVSSTTNGLQDIWMVGMDEFGNIQWEKLIGGSGRELFRQCIRTYDNNILLLASTESPISGQVSEASKGEFDVWVVKIDLMGNKIWDKVIGGSHDETAIDITNTYDEGFALVCRSETQLPSGDIGSQSNGDFDIWCVKLTFDGTISWEKFLGGTLYDSPTAIAENYSGHLIVGGVSASSSSGSISDSSNGTNDICLFKLDNSGSIIWNQLIGGSETETSSDILVTYDGGILISGSTSSSSSGDVSGQNNGYRDAWLVKTDGDGSIMWNNNLGGSNSESFQKMLFMDEEGILLLGSSTSSESIDVHDANNGKNDLWLIRLNSNGEFVD